MKISSLPSLYTVLKVLLIYIFNDLLTGSGFAICLGSAESGSWRWERVGGATLPGVYSAFEHGGAMFNTSPLPSLGRLCLLLTDFNLNTGKFAWHLPPPSLHLHWRSFQEGWVCSGNHLKTSPTSFVAARGLCIALEGKVLLAELKHSVNRAEWSHWS